jgi:intracellular septation protein
MQALYDFIPVLAFFLTYWLAGIYVATGVLLAATLVQVALQWLRRRTVSRMMLFSSCLVLLFGGATLILHNELFIMWKPTVLYGLFALALLGSQLFGAKPLVQRLLESQLSAEARVWRISNVAWALFFLALAAVNLLFVYRYSRDAWVSWKLAAIVLMLVFALLQGAWLARHGRAPDGPPGGSR